MGRGWKKFEAYHRKGLDCLKHTLGRKRDFEGASGDSPEGNEEDTVGD